MDRISSSVDLDKGRVGDGDAEDVKRARQIEEQTTYSDGESEEDDEMEANLEHDNDNLLDDEAEEGDSPVARKKETSHLPAEAVGSADFPEPSDWL